MSPVNVLSGATTTTVFFDEPTVSPTSNTVRGDPLPVGAIAGGTAGGVILALVAVWLWQVWGKSIRRTEAKKKKEADALRITKQNTLQNTYSSSKTHARTRSYSPLFWPPSETKVKFANPNQGESSFKTVPETLLSREVLLKPSRPKPLRPLEGASDSQSAPPVPVTEKIKAPALAKLPHKPSNISSASMYSTESASADEDHRRSRPSTFHSIVAALGNFSSDAVQNVTRTSQIGNRLSMASNWSFFSRSTRGTQNRLSQATSVSAYSQSDAQSSVVGVAY